MKFKRISMILLSTLMCLNTEIPAFACPTTINLPECEEVGDIAFRRCRKLSKIVLKKGAELNNNE